jgi:hypothetical protein
MLAADWTVSAFPKRSLARDDEAMSLRGVCGQRTSDEPDLSIEANRDHKGAGSPWRSVLALRQGAALSRLRRPADPAGDQRRTGRCASPARCLQIRHVPRSQQRRGFAGLLPRVVHRNGGHLARGATCWCANTQATESALNDSSVGPGSLSRSGSEVSSASGAQPGKIDVPFLLRTLPGKAGPDRSPIATLHRLLQRDAPTCRSPWLRSRIASLPAHALAQSAARL